MKPLQQHFHVMLFIYYEVLSFESTDEILWCYHSKETSSVVLSRDTIMPIESKDDILWWYMYMFSTLV